MTDFLTDFFGDFWTYFLKDLLTNSILTITRVKCPKYVFQSAFFQKTLPNLNISEQIQCLRSNVSFALVQFFPMLGPLAEYFDVPLNQRTQKSNKL